MRSRLFVALALGLILPLSAGAQTIGGLTDAGGDAITLAVSPDYPAPFSKVVITPSSSTVVLTNATMVVFVNDKQTYSGTAHSFSVNVGAGGTATKVRATVSVGGANYSQTLSIVPQDVIIIAEPLSSVPPLYLGKSSVPLGGSVRLVALANLANGKGGSSRPNAYSYVWTVDGVEMFESSGIGKSSIIVPAPLQYRSNAVSLKVTDPTAGTVSGTSLSLSSLDPIIRVYENDPLLGIRFDHALSNAYAIKNSEATLYAAPFSLPISSGAPLVEWFLNGTSVQTGTSVTLRPAGSGKGNASLSVTASAGSSNTTADLSLIFGSSKSSNFLGL